MGIGVYVFVVFDPWSQRAHLPQPLQFNNMYVAQTRDTSVVSTTTMHEKTIIEGFGGRHDQYRYVDKWRLWSCPKFGPCRHRGQPDTYQLCDNFGPIRLANELACAKIESTCFTCQYLVCPQNNCCLPVELHEANRHHTRRLVRHELVTELTSPFLTLPFSSPHSSLPTVLLQASRRSRLQQSFVQRCLSSAQSSAVDWLSDPTDISGHQRILRGTTTNLLSFAGSGSSLISDAASGIWSNRFT